MPMNTKSGSSQADAHDSANLSSITPAITAPSTSEIDLVDLGIVFWRRRWLMLAVFAVFVILTIIATVLKTPSYEYTTTLQLGSAVSPGSGSVVPLMSAQTVAQTIQDAYIPSAMYQYISENHLGSTGLRALKITATGAASGSNVVLRCRVKETRGPACVAMQKIAAAAFISNNSQFVTAARNQLTSLQSQAKVFEVQMDKLNTSAALYQQQEQDLERQITRMQQAGLQAARGATSGSAALSNLILNTEVQRAMDSLSSVRQQLEVQIPQQKALLAKQLDDNRSAQQLQEQAIAQGYAQVLNPGLRSLQPVGLSRAAVLALGIVLSIILAAIAAFIATYVGQVRTRLGPQTQR
ncbi:MAG: Wzz/FepE/Etk N-terminal domain-containing protein [Gammaproteobacteria bacterium]